MKNKQCYICFYTEYENKEYYLTEIDNQVAIKTLGKGYVWGNIKDALIFNSINIAKSYLKDLRKDAYIKLKTA